MWNNFQVASDSDEVVTNGYSTTALFKITSDSPVAHSAAARPPRVHAEVQNQNVVLTIDQSLFLLEHQPQQPPSADSSPSTSFLSFGSPVDAMCVSLSGCLVVCALSDGNVHGVHIGGVPLFNLCISTDDIAQSPMADNDGRRTFVGCTQIAGGAYFLACSNGRLYRLFNVDEAQMAASLGADAAGDTTLGSTAASSTMLACNETILNNVTIERCNGPEQRLPPIGGAQCCFVAMASGSGAHVLEMGFETLFAGDGRLVHWSPERQRQRSVRCGGGGVDAGRMEGAGGLKMLFNLEHFILGLGIDGRLYTVCPHTLLICAGSSATFDYLIDDIVVIECNADTIELLLLARDATESTRRMLIVDYPSMRVQFELPVASPAWLIRQAKSSANMYYLHGAAAAAAAAAGADQRPLHEIVMNKITETQPAERLKTLIARGHLAEATEFAARYSLSAQPIHEAQARRLVAEIGAIHCGLKAGNRDALQAKFAELLALAAGIRDTEFLLSLRTVDISDRTIKRTFLEFLVANYAAAESGGGAGSVAELAIAEITEQIARLDTLHLIDPHDCQLEWRRFVYHPHLVELVAQTLRTDVAAASLIWQHHTAALLPLVDDRGGQRTVDQLLAAIPTATPPFDLLIWCRHFVPSLAHAHPASVRSVADWCAERTRALQHSQHWPEVGLEFVQSTRAVFAGARRLVADAQMQMEQVLGGQDAQLRVLRDLCTLHDRYKLRMTLDDLQADGAEELANRILGRVALQDVPDMVRTFLHPRVFRQRRCVDAALLRHVHFLVANRKALAHWQERAVTLVQQLSDERERLECALQILKCAPVPWSPAVQPLAALRWGSHPLAVEIASQYELQAVKILRTKYGWPADGPADSVRLASRMCIVFWQRQREQQQQQHAGGGVEMLSAAELFADIRRVHDMEPQRSQQLAVLVQSVQQLCRRRQLERAAELVDSMFGWAEQASAACEMVLDVAGDVLQLAEEVDDETSSDYVEFLASIADRFAGDARLSHKYEAIRRMSTLRTAFGLPVSVAELRDPAQCAVYLSQGIATIEKRALQESQNSDASPSQLVRRCWTQTMRLADALRIDRMRALVQFGDTADNLPLTIALARWALQLIECDAHNCTHWMDLAALLCAQQIDDYDATPKSGVGGSLDVPIALLVAYRLLQRTVGRHRDVLFAYKELLEWPRMAASAFGAVEAERAVSDLYSLDEAAVQRMRRMVAEKAAAEEGGSGVSGLGLTKADPSRRNSMSIFDQVVTATNSPSATASADAGGGKSSASNAEAVLRCVANAMRLFVTLGLPEHRLFERVAKFYVTDIEALEDVENAFVKSLEHLIKAKLHAAAFAIIHQTLSTQRATSQVVISLPFASMFHRKALRYELSQKEPDFNDALAILLADSRPTECLQYLGDELRGGQQKINYLTLVERHSATQGDQHKFTVCRRTRMKYVYYTELCKSDASLRSRVDLDFTSIATLIRDLAHKRLDVDQLQRMSRDFSWDYELVLVKQILIVLDQQRLEFDVPTGSGADSSDEIVVRQPAFADILQTCAPYIDELRCTRRLADELLEYMETINFYFYEHYLNVIDMLAYVKCSTPEKELWRSVLLFLKHKMRTKRRCRIGQLETDAWLQAHPDDGVMPHIAYYRFPFWAIVKEPLKNLLDDELFVDNCEEWFPLIRLHADIMGKKHTDAQDHFCMSAVKNSMSEHCKVAKKGGAPQAEASMGGAVVSANTNGATNSVWCLEPVHNAFLQSIFRLVQHIHKPSHRLFCLYFVTNYLPEGADQIDAAHECYRYAQQHAGEFAGDQRTLETCAKIRRKYPMLKTQHLMHQHGLCDERLFRLIEQPREMIEALYGHEAVVRREATSETTVDIHALASEIAKLHDLDPRDVQLSLLNKWLMAQDDENGGGSGGGGDVDETFYEDPNVTMAADAETNTDNDVVKIHYILQSWDQTDAIQWLVSFIFAEDGAETAQQIKAFEVFIRLNKDDADEACRALFTQDQYVALKATHLLKQLGLNMSAAKFADYDKRSLLRRIWQSHATKPVALELIAIICDAYGIHNAQIWNGVLRQMVALNMCDQLAVLLGSLSARAELLRCEGLVRAWEHIIRAPFRGANRKRTPEQERALCAGLCWLQACPVFARVDVLELAGTCVRLQRPHMAAVMVAFAGCGQAADERRAAIVRMVREAVAATKTEGGGLVQLRKEIVELEEHGVYAVITKAAICALDAKE